MARTDRFRTFMVCKLSGLGGTDCFGIELWRPYCGRFANIWADTYTVTALLTRLTRGAITVDHSQGAQPKNDDLHRRESRSQLLLEVNNAIVSCLSLPELLTAVSACLRRVIAHDYAGLLIWDSVKNELRAHALNFAEGQDYVGRPLPLEGTVAGLAFTSGRPVRLERIDRAKFRVDWITDLEKRIGVTVVSCCVVPLISHQRKLGVLALVSTAESAFSEADEELLVEIAAQVAIAVENMLTFQQLQIAKEQITRGRDQLEMLLRVNNALVSHLNLRDLMGAVWAILHDVIHHEFAALALYNASADELRVYAPDHRYSGQRVVVEDLVFPAKGSVAEGAVRTGRTVYAPKLDTTKFDSAIVRRFIELGFKSMCSAPLMAHNRPLGALTAASSREDGFTENDVDMITQIAKQIALAVENALAYSEIEALKNKLSQEKVYLEDEIRTEGNFGEIIGESPALRNILKQVKTVAATDSTVLIRGETGTGKELIARAIHTLSSRRERTLVKVNCAAIPMGLLESELFGHEKGAFTGAISQRIGRFELANHGTLFLDEVGDIPLELQPKLLRVLQEQQFERLGSTRTQQVDVRLIAATNCDLETMVNEKRYRSDLYYRLNVFPVTVPPLRERPDDIPLLIRFFAHRFARRMKKPIESISAKTTAALAQYHWPGNVRELENVIERAVILSQGPELEIPLTELEARPERQPAIKSQNSAELSTLESVERDHILRVL